MKWNVLAIALLCLTGCQVAHVMMEQPSDRANRLNVDQTQTLSSAKLEKKTEVFTGKVVMIDGAYRLRLLKDPDAVLRLTRARKENEFAQQQINLRKYYEKTISVNGTLHDEWIFGADVVGQWTPPGGDTGPNMSAPKQTRP
ncbi:MAG TPA: hypothetical protein VNX27_00305 [Chthoniobacterales bacterium]|nr:hypothetical protein [Chthoniobacterales bacterium]